MDYERKRTWAEISLGAIEHNYREIRRVLPEKTRFLGVVKANAYGHGALQTADRLEKAGADYLAAACLDEAVFLRRGGIRLPILILGATPAEFASTLAALDLTQTVECAEKGVALSENLAPGEKLKIHIKLDTGMGRIGFPARDGAALSAAEAVMKRPNLICEGCFTHFAASDEPAAQEKYTRDQYETFIQASDRLMADTGIRFALRHCANSGCVLNYREYALDMVRPGLLTYGMFPADECGGLSLRPAMELKSRIAAITHHRRGGYDQLWPHMDRRS